MDYPRIYGSPLRNSPAGKSSTTAWGSPAQPPSETSEGMRAEMDRLMEMERSLFQSLLQQRDGSKSASRSRPPPIPCHGLTPEGNTAFASQHQLPSPSRALASSIRATDPPDLAQPDSFRSRRSFVAARAKLLMGAEPSMESGGKEGCADGIGSATSEGVQEPPPEADSGVSESAANPVGLLPIEPAEASPESLVGAGQSEPTSARPSDCPPSSDKMTEEKQVKFQAASEPFFDSEASLRAHPEAGQVSELEGTAPSSYGLERQSTPLFGEDAPLPRRSRLSLGGAQGTLRDRLQSGFSTGKQVLEVKEEEAAGDSRNGGTPSASISSPVEHQLKSPRFIITPRQEDQTPSENVALSDASEGFFGVDNTSPPPSGRRSVPRLVEASVAAPSGTPSHSLRPNHSDANFTWMFGFPLPSSRLPDEQAKLEHDLQSYGFKTMEGFFTHVFKIIQQQDVKELMRYTPPMTFKASPRTQATSLLKRGQSSPLACSREIQQPLQVKGDASAPLLQKNVERSKSAPWQVNSASHAAIKGMRGLARRASALSRRASSAFLGLDDTPPAEVEVQNAQQTAIELMLAFLPSFDHFCWDALKGRLSKRERKRRQKAFSEAEGLSSPVAKIGTLDDFASIQSIAFQSHTRDTLYVCLRTSNEAAELLADIAEYPVQLSPEGVRKLGVSVPESSTPTFAKYDAEFRQLCKLHHCAHEHGKWSVLRQIDCIRVLLDKITDFVDVGMLQSTGLLFHSLPLHHKAELHRLRRSWGNLRLLFQLSQPLPEIRDYFGEAVALYFLFLRELIHWTIGLLCMVVLCDMCFLYLPLAMFSRFTDRHLTISILLFVWYVAFRKIWTRREARYANLWGTDSHSKNSSSVKERPNFRLTGLLTPSPEDAFTPKMQVGQVRLVAGRCASLVLSALFVVAIVVIIAGECSFIYSVDTMLVTTLSGCFFGAQMKFVEAIWDKVSDYITDLEFRPTLIAYAHSKTTKTFAVRFVNAFAEIFFMAFLRPLMAEVQVEGMASQLEREQFYQTHLWMKFVATFTTRYMLLGTLNELTAPIKEIKSRLADHRLKGSSWTTKLKARVGLPSGCNSTSSAWPTGSASIGMLRVPSVAMSEPPQVLSFLEEQAQMPEYGLNELSTDFLDTLIPLGFVLFFGIIEPFSAFLLLILLLVQVRVTAWKLTSVYRRPFPMAAANIGVFDTVLNFYIYCSIATNLGLLLVDYGGLDSWGLEKLLFPASSDEARRLRSFCVALLFALLMVLLLRLFDNLVPGISHFVELEQRRQQLQHHLLFFNAKGSERMQMRQVSMTPGGRQSSRMDFDCVPTLEENSSMFHRGHLDMCNVYTVLRSWIDPHREESDLGSVACSSNV